MNRVAREVWARFPLYTLGLSVVLPLVAAVVMSIGTSGMSCVENTPTGVYLNGGVSPVAIAVAFAGVIAAAASLASASLRPAAFLRDPGGDTRWASGGMVFFLVFPLVMLALNIFLIPFMYSSASGYQLECV